MEINLEPGKFEISKCPFYTALIVSVVLSFLAQLDTQQEIKNLVSLSSDLLGESKAIKTYEFFLYMSFAFCGLAGFGYSRRHVPTNAVFSGSLGYLITGFLGAGGVLLGWGYGVLLHTVLFNSEPNLVQGIGIISLFSMFILVPIFMVTFYISQVNTAREPQSFKQKFNVNAFKWLSLALFSIGAFGALNMAI